MDKKQISLVALLFFSFLILDSSPSSALLVAQCSNSTFIQDNSEYIIDGGITKVESRWENNSIYTYVDVTIFNYAKGAPIQGNYIQLKIPGGGVGLQTQWVEDMPAFSSSSVGKSYTFYLARTGGSFGPVCGGAGVTEMTLLDGPTETRPCAPLAILAAILLLLLAVRTRE
ncbi:MAG: hypothetical protein WC488_02005 [Candidatus Micrarchaeia archaeon]